MSGSTTAGAYAPGDGERERRVAWYVVAILLLASISSWVDRQVLALVLEPIKADFGLSDTQVSLLAGPAFGVVYGLLGFVMGRIADTRSRRALIGWGIAAWSLMSTFTGLARSFGQLFLSRVGVGIGEATLSPAAYSLLADYFPPRRLALALSVFGTGIFMGAGLGYLIGGGVAELAQHMQPWHLPIVGEIRPWQKVFIFVGIPGVVLALLMLTVPEPLRGGVARDGASYPVRLTLQYLRQRAGAFTAHGVGTAAFSLVNLGTATWFPAFFMRAHGWTYAEVGLYMGGTTLVFGTLGVLAGGRTAGWLERRGHTGANLTAGIIGAAGTLLAAFPLYLSSSFGVLIGALIVTNFFAAFPWGAFAAAVQEMTPAPMRGQASALYLFLINVIGGAAGPPAVALLTDNVFRSEALVGMSLLVVTVGGRLVSMAALTAGLKPYRRAVEAASAWTPSGAPVASQ